MIKDYTSINGTTIASDEKGIRRIETTDRIEEKLNLENEIEIIKNSIMLLNAERSKLGTVNSNKKYKIKCYIYTAILFISTFAISKLPYNSMELPTSKIPFIHTLGDSCLLFCFSLLMLTYVPYVLIEIHKINKRIKKILEPDEQLEYLHNELSKKREELENLQRNSQIVNITESDVHSIDNSKYRTILNGRLEILKEIKKYRNKLRKHLENGTLLEEFKKLEIMPENMPFAEEVLKRTLEK